MRFKRLDVRPILAAGGSPLDEVRRRLAMLKPAEGLVVQAPFLPSPLIEMLRGEGYLSRIERGRAGEWLVHFWRAD